MAGSRGNDRRSDWLVTHLDERANRLRKGRSGRQDVVDDDDVAPPQDSMRLDSKSSGHIALTGPGTQSGLVECRPGKSQSRHDFDLGSSSAEQLRRRASQTVNEITATLPSAAS